MCTNVCVCVCIKQTSLWFSPVTVWHRDSYLSPRESFLSEGHLLKKQNRKWLQMPPKCRRSGLLTLKIAFNCTLGGTRKGYANKPRTHTQLHLSPLQKRLFSILSAGDNRCRNHRLTKSRRTCLNTSGHPAPPRCLCLAAMASGDIIFLFGHTRLCLHLQLFCNKI